MSATLPNLDVLAKWLNATLYHTEFRPIPLFEYLKIGKTVYKSPELIQSFDLKAVYDIPVVCLYLLKRFYMEKPRFEPIHH